MNIDKEILIEIRDKVKLAIISSAILSVLCFAWAISLGMID